MATISSQDPVRSHPLVTCRTAGEAGFPNASLAFTGGRNWRRKGALWGPDSCKSFYGLDLALRKVHNAGRITVTPIFFRENHIRDPGHTSALTDAWGVKKEKNNRKQEAARPQTYSGKPSASLAFSEQLSSAWERLRSSNNHCDCHFLPRLRSRDLP